MNCIYGEISHFPMKISSHHHDCDCENSHEHDYKSVDKKVLKISFFITIVAMFLEFFYGVISGSLALVSDAIHMMTHAFALGISFFAILISRKNPDNARTFGYYRSEVVAAFINAIIVILSVIFIIYEAILRFINPGEIEIKQMIIVAFIGLVVNVITGYLLYKGDMDNINIKSAFIHMMSDLLSSVAIIIGGIVLYFTNLYIIDTILALLISVVIFKWGYELLKDSILVLIESSPVNVKELENRVMREPKIKDIHDIHVMEISHGLNVMSAHILLDRDEVLNFKEIVEHLGAILREEFGISHITLQPEWE